MRGRRSNRKKVSALIANKNFLIFVIILIVIIVISFGTIQIRTALNKQKLAKQAKELNQKTFEIFSEMDEKLANIKANPSDGEQMKTKIAKISAVGDILCQADMIENARTENEYDFSNIFSDISQFVKNADLAVGTLETNFVEENFSGSRQV